MSDQLMSDHLWLIQIETVRAGVTGHEGGIDEVLQGSHRKYGRSLFHYRDLYYQSSLC